MRLSVRCSKVWIIQARLALQPILHTVLMVVNHSLFAREKTPLTTLDNLAAICHQGCLQNHDFCCEALLLGAVQYDIHNTYSICDGDCLVFTDVSCSKDEVAYGIAVGENVVHHGHGICDGY